VPQTTDSPEVVDALHEALQKCGAPGEAPDEHPWKNVLHDCLCDRALPAVIWDGTITPAASLWTGSRLWTQAFRSGGLEMGDRLVLALPPNTTFVQVLLAAIWQGCTVCLLPPSADVEAACETLDARAAVAPDPGPRTWTPEGYSGPRTTPDALRSPRTDPTPDVRFLVQTSGTTGLARWVALSDRNVLSVLASHLPHFRLGNARVLSVLPWTHAFGLVLDLFPALLAGAEIIREPEGGRDPQCLLSLSDAWGATHLSAVPLVIRRLLDHDGGEALLQRLQGGVVGGAPVSGPLADALADTQLRAGYGQTEAAPGITLGAPGTWAANYLGQPVGCEVSVAEDGELLFEGDNACVGFWEDGRLRRVDPDRTVETGDLVRREGEHFFFQGRKDDAFKLSNGRLVRAGYWEATVKDAFPDLRDALLFTHDGTDLTLAVCVPPSTSPPAESDLRDTLGSLSARTEHVVVLPPDRWASTPKGVVDRSAMTDRLTDDLPRTA
jgi:acyl-CoA synthetase (AMP-forming)/AMP-acid ligase II